MPAEDARYHYNQARKLLAKAENVPDERHELIRLAEVHLNIWNTLRSRDRRYDLRPYWQTNSLANEDDW